MKSYFIPVLALGLLVSSVSAQDKPDLTNPKQKTSYAIGLDIAASFKRQELDVDTKALTAGIADGFAGKPALTEEEMKATLMDLQKSVMARMEEKQKAAAGTNLKAGEAFLAANAKKVGVKTTASGLQYKVIKSGAGPSPKPTDVVKVHYHGTLIDGTVFDSSVQRNTPATFPVNGVIPGWTEALQLMKVGDKWQLVIPSKLAYGEEGPGPIGPNSVLIFEVELLGIEKPAAAQ
jgi:FKBP-type peptidyl-prolyl cis-trans isomerase FklB